MAQSDNMMWICIMDGEPHEMLHSVEGDLMACNKCHLMWGSIRNERGQMEQIKPLVGVRSVPNMVSK